MARLITSGFELNRVGTVTSEPDGSSAGTAATTIQATTKRSGGFAAQCASGAGNGSAYTRWAQTYAASTTYYCRGYFCFANLPTGTPALISLGARGTNGGSVRMTSGGLLQLVDSAGAAQVGSSSGALTADGATFYRIEISMTVDGSSHVSALAALIDGVQFASGSVTTSVAITAQMDLGWVSAPGANLTCYVDDVALNDSAGSSQTSYPGDGKVVLLIPTATSAAGTGWVLGNNTAEGGNGWNSVNNEPPVGIADLGGAGADTGQIRNATSSANSNFDATMTTYTAAGCGTGSTVNVLDPITATAAPVSTSAKQGTVGVSSNPAITNIALAAGGTSGAFWSGVAGGTYVTGWKWSHGTTTYAPSVTLGTAPVMRVTQVTSSTRIAVVCFMGIYVEFIGVTTAKAGFGKENA